MKFEKQTYTQVPNSLFIEMKNMNECELKVVMLICRYTFGYHREEVKLSTRRIADEIGMNTASVQKGAESAVERGLIEKVIDGNKTTTWRAVVSDSNSDTPAQSSDSNSDTRAIQILTRGDSNSESLLGIKERINKKKKGDLLDGLLFYGQQAKEQQADKVEEVIQELERGLHVNITRTTNNQAVAKRIVKDGRPVSTWLAWVVGEEWRAAHLYIYADLEKVWRDFPQAFKGDANMNPQGLEVGI